MMKKVLDLAVISPRKSGRRLPMGPVIKESQGRGDDFDVKKGVVTKWTNEGVSVDTTYHVRPTARRGKKVRRRGTEKKVRRKQTVDSHLTVKGK